MAVGNTAGGRRTRLPFYVEFLGQFDSLVSLFIVVFPLVLVTPMVYNAIATHTVSPDDFNSCHTTDCNLHIPMIIHQTYKTEELPDQWKETPSLWKKHHPEWQYMFWSDEKNRDFISTHYPWFLEQFDAYPNNIQRADAIRYFILYHYGGVYVDMDIQPVRDLSPMLGDYGVVLPETPNIGLTNAFMASAKEHPFFEQVIHALGANAHRWMHFTRHWEIVTSTGPYFIWDQANLYKDQSEILRVPASVWGKCKMCDPTCPLVPNAYFQHLHGDSWHDWDSFFFTYVLMCHQYEWCLIGTCVLVFVTFRGYTPLWARKHTHIIVLSMSLFLLAILLN
eukprot:m.362570 g.362570  ORF g.362570 m.362570 type:complete len:336 (+) comp20645_c0_seq1:86-1093(+)